MNPPCFTPCNGVPRCRHNRPPVCTTLQSERNTRTPATKQGPAAERNVDARLQYSLRPTKTRSAPKTLLSQSSVLLSCSPWPHDPASPNRSRMPVTSNDTDLSRRKNPASALATFWPPVGSALLSTSGKLSPYALGTMHTVSTSSGHSSRRRALLASCTSFSILSGSRPRNRGQDKGRTDTARRPGSTHCFGDWQRSGRIICTGRERPTSMTGHPCSNKSVQRAKDWETPWNKPAMSSGRDPQRSLAFSTEACYLPVLLTKPSSTR